MKLLLQHREENIKVFLQGRTNYNQLLATSLKGTQEELEKVGQFFQVTIHFNPSHPQLNIINISYFALVGLLLTKLNHCFDDSQFKQIRFSAIDGDTKLVTQLLSSRLTLFTSCNLKFA